MTFVDEQHLSELHGLPGRPGRRDRADRRLGARCARNRRRESGAERTGPWWLHGAALAVLPWLHTRFALVAGCLGALVLLRLGATRNAAGKAVAFLSVPAASAIGWIGFFIAIYGTPDPSAPYANEAGSVAFIPGGLAGLLFDQRFGLLAYAPVLACAFAGLGVMVRNRETRRLGLELLFVLDPVSAHRHAFRDVVGRLKRAGAVLRADALRRWRFRRPPRGRRCATAPRGHGARRAARDGVRLVRAGVRRRRPAGLQQSRRLRRLAGVARTARPISRGGCRPGGATAKRTLFRDVAIWACAIAVAWGLLRAAQGTRWLRTRGALCAATAGVYAACGHVRDHDRLDAVGRRRREPDTAQLALLRRLGAERRALDVRAPVMASPRVRRGAGRAPHRAAPLDDARRRRGHRSAVVSGPARFPRDSIGCGCAAPGRRAG